jgi:hypothetical protein
MRIHCNARESEQMSNGGWLRYVTISVTPPDANSAAHGIMAWFKG